MGLSLGHSDLLLPLTPRYWSVGFESCTKSVGYSCPRTSSLVSFWGCGR